MRHDDLIENKGSHKYLRRIPWPGRKKKYRYVYDSRIAAQLSVQPSPGEKVRVPHGEQPGHYEILRVLKLGTGVVADLQHDETGYRMFVPVENLHKLVKEALTTPPKPKKTKSPKITAAKLRAEYRKADALPKARWRTLNMILDSSGVQDYGLRKRDQQYLSWQRGTDKKPAPLPDKDGSLDGFNVRGERKTRFCCLREAFNHATANAETWRDLIPVVEKLRTVPDLEGVNLPAEVMSRHAEEDATLRGVEAGLVSPTVDYTRYGVPFDGGMPEDDLLFLAITHDPEAAAQAGGFEAPDEPEEDPWMNPFVEPYTSDEVVSIIKDKHKRLLKHGIRTYERLNSFYLLLSGVVLEDGYSTVYWSVLDEHRPIAAGSIELDTEDPDDQFFWERNAFVLPAYQRRGIYKGVIASLNRLYGEIEQDPEHTEANAAFWKKHRSGE